MKLATWHWHIEISSKCTLKCPRCARAEVPDSLINTELSLDFFKRNFTAEFIMNNVEKITLCGDDGDPIYAKSLVEVIKYFKSVKPVSFVIITNGSHRAVDWWGELGSVLDHNDHIHFSIDGYDNDSNNIYRVNSDWDSIMAGVKTIRETSSVFLTWAAIGFSFNQLHLPVMQHLAASLGFDYFQLTKSTKFGKVYPTYLTNGSDALQPVDTLVSDAHRFTRHITSLSGRIFNDKTAIAVSLYSNATTINGTMPLCQVGGKGLYISARGKLYPCCWVANRYGHNSDWEKLSIDLTQVDLITALADEFWDTDFETFRWAECSTKCSAKNASKEYCTSW